MSANHQPGACVGCGQPWPCRGHFDERNRALVLLAIRPGGSGDLKFVGEWGGTWVEGPTGTRLPIDDPEVQAALVAVGYRIEGGTISFGGG